MLHSERLQPRMTSPKDGRRSDTMRGAFALATIIISRTWTRSSAQFIDPRTSSRAIDAILPADRVVASDYGLSAVGCRAV